jgi:ferredoxin
MVLYDPEKCTHCGLCLEMLGNYCLFEQGGTIRIDYAVCNRCQKCIAVCPSMAFSHGHTPPERIDRNPKITPEDLSAFMERRRSVRRFKDMPVERRVLESVAACAGYAPTMNRDIELVIVDDRELIRDIDRAALRFYGRLYKLLFGFKPVTAFIRIFSGTITNVKKKMEHSRGLNRVVYENTQALIVSLGNTKVPLSEVSAQYCMAYMVLGAEAWGLGSCLLDSVKILLNASAKIKKKLNIPRNMKILGVLSLGVPDEKILNVPKGYLMKTSWNKRGQASP